MRTVRLRGVAMVALLVGFVLGLEAAQQYRFRYIGAYAQASELSAGDIVIRLSGGCGAGFAEVADLDGYMLRGTVASHMDQGDDGGDDTITPAGSNSGGAVDAHAGAAVQDHAAHTHSVTSNVSVDTHASHTHTYTEVVNHTHGFTDVRGATTGGATTARGFTEGNDNSSTVTTQVTANPGGGVAAGTTAGPGAALTHTTNNPAVTSGNPSATLTHSVTQPSAHAFTQPTFTGTEFDNRPAFKKVILCAKS